MTIQSIKYKTKREPFQVIYDYKGGDGFVTLSIYRNACQIGQTLIRGITDEKLLYQIIDKMTINDFYDIINYNITIV
jgi:hypothetical protein